MMVIVYGVQGAIQPSCFIAMGGAATLLAEARFINLRNLLVVGQVGIRAAGNAGLAAHATSTYSIPHQSDLCRYYSTSDVTR
jgi:hypothetical protein